MSDIAPLFVEGLDLPRLKQYLENNGAKILRPTNPWEVFRYELKDVTSVIYKNKIGKLTYTGTSKDDVERS